MQEVVKRSFFGPSLLGAGSDGYYRAASTAQHRDATSRGGSAALPPRFLPACAHQPDLPYQDRHVHERPGTHKPSLPFSNKRAAARLRYLSGMTSPPGRFDIRRSTNLRPLRRGCQVKASPRRPTLQQRSCRARGPCRVWRAHLPLHRRDRVPRLPRELRRRRSVRQFSPVAHRRAARYSA